MSIKIKAQYKGNFKFELEHEPSGSKLITDAPADHYGKGEDFSPTDLVVAALISCIVTTIAIVAEKEGIKLSKISAEGVKNMRSQPRRTIGPVPVIVHLPVELTVEERKLLEERGRACPVHKALTAETEVSITYNYS